MIESNSISQMPQSTRTYDERLESGVIATTKLTRRFDGLVAVNDLTFSMGAGTIFGLLGPNGAGKSTLIKMLTTLLPPSSGTAIVAGFDILSHIGYVSQMLSADGELTGYENLLISAKLYGLSRSDRAERISQALEFMQLQEAGHKLVKQYSGGMIRRLEIAQSMLHRPPVLFLDEPTVGLDPAAKHSVWQRILDLKKELGTSVLMTTHDMEEANHLCDAIAFMHQGKLLATGSLAELKTALGPSANLDDVFIHYAGSSIAEGGTLRDVAQTRHTAQRLE